MSVVVAGIDRRWVIGAMVLASIQLLLFGPIGVACASTSSDWRWPTSNHALKNDWPTYSSGSWHGGTDFPVSLGTPVHASCDCVIESTQSLTTSYGVHVKARATVEGQTVYIRYCHLTSYVVSPGDAVKAGDVIGYSGSTGNSTGPHLHYEVRGPSDSWKGDSLNPRLYLPGTSYRYVTHDAAPPPNNQPIGTFDGADGGMGTVEVRGWAFDPDEPAKYLGIHVYVDGPAGVGRCIGTGTANAFRPDVDEVHHMGINHGFEFAVECPSGAHDIYVHAIDTAGGHNPYLGGGATSGGAIRVSVQDPLPASGARVATVGECTYRIQSKIGARMVEVEGAGTANGTNIQLASESGKARQRWQLTWNAAQNGFTLQNAATGKYLDAEGGDAARIANVSQFESANTRNNNWLFEDAGNGYYYIRDLLGYYLDVEGGANNEGANVQVYTFNGTDAQKWRLVTVHQGEVVTDFPEGTYNIKMAAAPGALVDVEGASVEEGANVQIWEKNGGPAQEFRFERNADGSYVITNPKSNRSLDVHYAKPDNNTNVLQSQTHRGDNQSWWIESTGDGAYFLRAKHSSLYMDVNGGHTANGTNVQVHIPNGSNAQRFLLERVDKVAPTISDVRVSDVSPEGYTVSCRASDDVGVARVAFPTWTLAGGQDDLETGWDEGGASSVGTRDGDSWTFRVRAADHGGEAGAYRTHVYAWDAAGNSVGVAAPDVEVPVPGPDLTVPGWATYNGAKYYVRSGALVTGWMDLGGSKYYFQPDGKMSTGWTDVDVSGKTMHYYFNPASGNLARGTWMTIDAKKYYFRPSGNLATGWATISDNGVDKKYYFNGDGQLLTGWQDIEVNGKIGQYYFRPSGAMATGWATVDGEKLFFRPSGNMATGFTDVGDGHKRYFDEFGHMLVGWQVIGGKTYYFRASGAMQTGKATIDGASYEFSASGTLKSGNPTALSAQGEGETVELGGGEEETSDAPDLAAQEGGLPVDGEALPGPGSEDSPKPDVEVLGNEETDTIVLGDQ